MRHNIHYAHIKNGRGLDDVLREPHPNEMTQLFTVEISEHLVRNF